ncbi:hypothetical protein SHI21_08135 [Bacteriovorax sp. PP10]|uniref:Uncharacterized protein n=1 Tax=Bacteriovorax antarcticus TaxID=3088717 RepID=A0ABU5VSY6_9BACT|nr:hypothetical protein [Bacteriovorax sp. PP10]MEA9356166.1 hypothetical protein [Bacteriovorax sp. PP10]
MKTTLLLVLIILSANVVAKDTILFIGGGGEPLSADETQFDGSLEGIGAFHSKNKNSYDAVVNFNGGHSKTEKKISKYFSGQEVVPDFTTTNYNKVVDDLIKKLSANPPQIRAGEKLLVFINSHGSEKQAEKTHSISTSRSAMTSMNAGGAGMVSLDKLKELADLAEKKNVRLGIIDGSCHAGNSLALANSKTCVVAGSGPNHYSYSDFAEVYAKKMTKGRNLEDIFLETNDEVLGKGFPMISSPAGVAAQDELYPYLTPYMYYHDEYRGMALDKIDNYMKATSSPELVCVRENEYVKLESLVKLIESMSKVAKAEGALSRSVDLSGLEKELADYKKTQDKYFQKLSQLDLSGLNKIEKVRVGNLVSPTGFTHKELLKTNFEFFIQNKVDLLKDPKLDAKKEKQALELIAYYKAAMLVKERVIRENPQYAQQQVIIEGLKTDNDVGFQVAAKIMKEAHEAYNALYKIRESEMVKQAKRAPNPCKDFVL